MKSKKEMSRVLPCWQGQAPGSAGASGVHVNVVSPLHAEILAARHAAKLLVQIVNGGQDAAFEGDSCITIAALQRKEDGLSTFGRYQELSPGHLRILKCVTFDAKPIKQRIGLLVHELEDIAMCHGLKTLQT